MGEFEERFIKPIVNASYPATLAGIDLAVLQFTSSPGKILSLTFLLGSASFILGGFSIFAFTIYPTRKKFWTWNAFAFILGLLFSVVAVIVLLVRLFFPGFLYLPGETTTFSPR